MKYGKIMLFSGIALAVSLVMRLLQIIFTVDTSTGFFKTEYTAAGYYLMVMTAVICAATAFICFISHRSPARPPRTNAFMSAASFLMVPAIFIELYAESFSGTVMVRIYSLCGYQDAAASGCAARDLFYNEDYLFVYLNILARAYNR